MTKEELDKEAEKYCERQILLEDVRDNICNAYLAGAEPREKRISELDKENGILESKLADLQSEYIELENFNHNEVNELKAQIEQMKCCENCRHFDFDEPKYCHKGVYNCAYVCDKWELGD